MLTIFAVAVLVGPLFALHYAKKQVLRLALIAVFSLVFALAVSLATKSRNFEIFAATAAYVCRSLTNGGSHNANLIQICCRSGCFCWEQFGRIGARKHSKMLALSARGRIERYRLDHQAKPRSILPVVVERPFC